MSTLRILLVVFVAAGAGFGLGAVFADGAWQDLWLNLFAESFGAAIIVFFVDRLLERSRARDREARRRAALRDLGYVLEELRLWLVRLLQGSESGVAWDPDEVPVETLVSDLPEYLGRIDFAAAGPYKRDRYFAEWARRSFEREVLELARWEQNFAGAAGIFDDDFRQSAERLHSFVRAMGSFLEGMERYVLREQPPAPVRAYDGVTELTDANAQRLVGQLRDFLGFYHDQCEKHGLALPEHDRSSR
jgi:hypothetical protein